MQTITTISLARLKSQDIVKRYSLEMTFKGYLLPMYFVYYPKRDRVGGSEFFMGGYSK